MRRYPIDALLALTDMPYSAVVGRVNSESWNNMRDVGLTPYMADKLAVKCGYHPSLVWHSWWDDEIAELSVPCAGCAVPFMPSRKGHVYCTDPECRAEQKRIRQRASRRSRYQSDPEYRARRREQQRLYYEECRRALIAQNRAWTAANRERVKERRRAYYEANREHTLARQRAYYQENRERIVAAQRVRDQAKRAVA